MWPSPMGATPSGVTDRQGSRRALAIKNIHRIIFVIMDIGRGSLRADPVSGRLSNMRQIAQGGRRPHAAGSGVRSVACILFVAALGVGFWSGVIWTGRALMRLAAG